jgi:hypothetical protein
MRAPYAGRKVDASAKALEAHAKALGVDCAPLGGAVDAIWWLGRVLRAVDYKSPGKAALTESQGKLIARGLPLNFVSTPQQVEALVSDMKREANA